MAQELNNQQQPHNSPFQTPTENVHARQTPLVHSLQRSIDQLFSLQRTDGYWWFTLEANETIGAEFIFLMNFLRKVDEKMQQAIAQRILDVQRADGTWAIYHEGPACLSSTVECYFALKLAGISPDEPNMVKAREFILANGGIEKTRVFTKIHLALFGIVPWWACPTMPAEFILLPNWFPVNIYEFSSWARASIVPLLIVMSIRPVHKLAKKHQLDELFCNPPESRDFKLRPKSSNIAPENMFIYMDRFLKFFERSPLKPLRNYSIRKAKKWIWDHVEHVEDIYPALAYAAIAYHTLGYEVDSPEIRKPLEALWMFQQRYTSAELPAAPEEIRDDGLRPPSKLRKVNGEHLKDYIQKWDEFEDHKVRIHQQCCVSPVWDTPWSMIALLEAGVSPVHPQLVLAARWLLKKQITEIKGDWAVKCDKSVKPGGWSFEFENAFFPDVDDTIEVLHVLKRVQLPKTETAEPCERAINWLLAMQNDDGGWGAFDRNNDLELVNKIPFADHGACLDPSTPDITGRMIELFIDYGFSAQHPALQKAIAYLKREQTEFGGWLGRWGINYIYGTWAVLTAFGKLGDTTLQPEIDKAVRWLKSIQREDGGFSESPESYVQKTFIPYSQSTASQSAWALMALVAAGETQSPSTQRAMEYLLKTQNERGTWDEAYSTGTGFPGHFYIRYHGYRHYFPLLALGRYHQAKNQ